MKMPTRLLPALPAALVGILLFIPTGTASAEWMGRYFNTILGTRWTYENVDIPGETEVDSCFGYHLHEGNMVVRVGAGPDDNTVVNNTGRIITLFAVVDQGVEHDFPEDIELGWFEDGDRWIFCPFETDCDTSLIRVWTEIDPALRAIYGLDPAVDDLILLASYDPGYPPNLHNTILESGLPDDFIPPAGAITGVEWYQWKVGLYANRDIDAQSGGFGDFYRLVDFITAVPGDRIDVTWARLDQNYPNPFNPATSIGYELDRPSSVSLSVFDCAGRLVRTFVPGETQPAGRHTWRWNGRDDRGRILPSGKYLCQLTAGPVVATRSMVLLR